MAIKETDIAQAHSAGLTPTRRVDSSIQFGITRKSLEAIRILACPHCDAPGVYKDDEHNRKNWPGIVDSKRVGQHVGDTCPNCGKPREPDKNLGELTASIPLWVWKCILGFKWCVIMIRRLFIRRKSDAHYQL